jgi:hypothetical protein
VLTAAVEGGFGDALFTAETAARAKAWQGLAAFNALHLQPDGRVLDGADKQVCLL